MFACDIKKFFKKTVSGPLTALSEGELRRAIKDQADLLSALENENVLVDLLDTVSKNLNAKSKNGN